MSGVLPLAMGQMKSLSIIQGQSNRFEGPLHDHVLSGFPVSVNFLGALREPTKRGSHDAECTVQRQGGLG